MSSLEYNLFSEAINAGNIIEIEMLLNNAKELNDNNHTLKQLLLPETGNPPLKNAVIGGNVGIVEVLLQFAKDINDNNETLKQLVLPETDYLPLNIAIENGNLVAALMMLNSAKDIDDDNSTLKRLLLPERGFPPLDEAVNAGNIIAIKLLLNIAKDLNDDYHTLKQLLLPETDNPPLNKAVIGGNVGVVEVLLSYAKDINDDNHMLKKMFFNDSNHASVLSDAVRGGHWDIAKLLITVAARIDIELLKILILIVDVDGENVVRLMIKNGPEEMYAYLLKIFGEEKYQDIQKEVVNIYDNVQTRLRYYRDELFAFIYQNQITKIKEVLDNYMQSSKNPNVKLATLLLALDDSGYNAFDIAFERGYIEIIKVLLAYSITINDEGMTLKDLVSSRFFKDKTHFEISDFKVIGQLLKNLKSLLLEAENNNNKTVADVLQPIAKEVAEIYSILIELEFEGRNLNEVRLFLNISDEFLDI